mgnify:CR=1 FL=1
MHREILEQPQAVEETVAATKPAIQDLVKRLRKVGIEHTFIVARGTSDHAATYGLYMLGAIAGRLVGLAAPSLLTCYDADFDLRKSLVIGVTQSGAAIDVHEVLEVGKRRGAVTCALTNTEDSPICAVAEHVLLTHARVERSVAATKTYTTALAVMHQLATRWAGREDLADEIHRVPEWMSQTLELDEVIRHRAERFRFMDCCHWLARGLHYCTAKEAALKMAECCYVVPSPFSTADFMHGPIATTEPGFPCFVVATRGPVFGAVCDVVHALRTRKAELVILSDDDDLLGPARIGLKLPAVPEECSPMVAAPAIQLLALRIALEKGLDPDHPRGLKKVTLTR